MDVDHHSDKRNPWKPKGSQLGPRKNFVTKVYKPAQRLYVLKRDLGAKTNKNWYNIN